LVKKKTFELLSKKHLSMMTEGFWWGFVAVCKKSNINFKEVPINHHRREKGIAGYRLKSLPGIIIRNIIGLFKIKFSKINC